jgi:tRNA modification GTPase
MKDYRTYFREDTIAAVITPPGTGGVAIVRVSGKNAKEIVKKVFSKDPFSMPSHTVTFGKIKSPIDQGVIDEGLCLYMKGPNSFTGEDVIELQFHGNNLIAKKVVEALIVSGATAAHPGEFSFRAYRMGKIDLLQAKAIQEMIGARNEKSLKAAQVHLEGKLSKHLIEIKKALLESAAILDAWVDFPEEGLEFMSFEEMIENLEKEKDKIDYLINSFRTGQILFEGATICLIGEPNVGKSSLMNALLGKSRAIVTPIAGTTRDIIEDDLRLFDLTVRLKDTAGIREASEEIEQEGIKLSLKAIDEADLVLFIKEASKDSTPKEKEILAYLDPSKTVFIANKIDQQEPLSDHHLQTHFVSAKYETGIDDLKQVIYKRLLSKDLEGKEDLIIMDASQKEVLKKIYDLLDLVIMGLKEGNSPEFIVMDLKEVLKLLASLVGIDVTEDVLTALFSKFCVGK